MRSIRGQIARGEKAKYKDAESDPNADSVT